MGLPAGKKIHGKRNNQGDHHAGLPAKGIAEHQKKPGHGGQQKNGLDMVSHGSPREKSVLFAFNGRKKYKSGHSKIKCSGRTGFSVPQVA
jgi:hypothetical protein